MYTRTWTIARPPYLTIFPLNSLLPRSKNIFAQHQYLSIRSRERKATCSYLFINVIHISFRLEEVLDHVISSSARSAVDSRLSKVILRVGIEYERKIVERRERRGSTRTDECTTFTEGLARFARSRPTALCLLALIAASRAASRSTAAGAGLGPLGLRGALACLPPPDSPKPGFAAEASISPSGLGAFSSASLPPSSFELIF